MAPNKKTGFDSMSDTGIDPLDNIGSTVKAVVKPQVKKQTGRPRQTTYAQDKKVTFRIPEDLHRQLRLAGADQDKPMAEIVADALVKHLKAYEGK